MEEYFNIKELYDVSLRATFPITIKGKTYKENEPIIKFNKIQLAPLTENKSRVYASGGFDNRRLVEWETTREVTFILSEGIISKTGLALLSNSKLLDKQKGEVLPVPFCEELETNSDGVIETKYPPIQDNTLFIYDKLTGDYLTPLNIENNKLTFEEPYKEILIDYTFLYEEKAEILSVGNRLINGYLKLDGKVRLKDDSDGHIKTGIIEIPRLKLMSDLSMRLGRDADPYVYRFQITGFPVGERGNQYVSKIIILDNEIDSDL